MSLCVCVKDGKTKTQTQIQELFEKCGKTELDSVLNVQSCYYLTRGEITKSKEGGKTEKSSESERERYRILRYFHIAAIVLS